MSLALQPKQPKQREFNDVERLRTITGPRPATNQ